MPAHDPQPQLPLGLPPAEQKKALKQSKMRLIRHAILSGAVVLFLIGFNAAFTREIIWFPWPVAALFILWLVHLQKHLNKAKTSGLSFNVWMDDEPSGLSGARDRANPGFGPQSAGEPDPPDREDSRSRRKREWLE